MVSVPDFGGSSARRKADRDAQAGGAGVLHGERTVKPVAGPDWKEANLKQIKKIRDHESQTTYDTRLSNIPQIGNRPVKHLGL